MAYIKIDGTNRITAASYDFHCGEGEIELTIPDEITLAEIHEYKYENGELIYDPIPKPSTVPVAPHNIMAGEYITVDGVLYKATVNIPSGEYIITGQNAIKTTIDEQLAELAKGE